ncbi:MAG: thiamine phosphate synthase [Alphaproteobacteria bacterium]|nr:thiamine phosphate synthase [Alphaproteobacteria bacterium]
MTLTNEAVKLNSAWRRRHPGRRSLPPIFLVTDPHRLPDPRPFLRNLPRGGGVIYRSYNGGGDRATRLDFARRLLRACHERGLLLLIAGDDRLAAAVGADGIHLAEWRLRRGAWKRAPIHRRGGLVTAACHGRAALARADSLGIDAALLAPVFVTESHPRARPLGARRFSALVRVSRLPVFALGGVGPRTVARIRYSGAAGIAGIGGIVESQA